jgi:hypothetical protein
MISIEGLLEDEQGLSKGELLTVKLCQPSHDFTFGVGMNFISYPLVLTPWYNKFTCACRFWSLVFTQGFSVESETSGISSLSNSWQDLEAGTSQAMKWTWLQELKDQAREDDKLGGPSQKSAESCETRSFVQFGEKLTTRAHMQNGERSRRLGKQHLAKEATNWAEMGPGHLSQAGRPSPFRGPVAPPLT